MPEDDDSETDGRVDRLRSKRRRTRELGEQSEADEQSESDEHSEASKPSKQSEQEKPSEPDEQGERSEPSEPSESGETGEASESIKNELVGTYMYLPEPLKEDINRYYSKISGEYEFEYGEDFEKNRHYYQLVARHGFETIREADIEEIREMVNNL